MHAGTARTARSCIEQGDEQHRTPSRRCQQQRRCLITTRFAEIAAGRRVAADATSPVGQFMSNLRQNCARLLSTAINRSRSSPFADQAAKTWYRAS
jgi:hypothetical protein